MPLAAALTLFTEPSNVCKFRCKFRPESFVDYEDSAGVSHPLLFGGMDLITQDIGKVAGGVGVKMINLYVMGEPLINPQLPEIIHMCPKSGSAERLIAPSNGSLLEGKRAEQLAASPPDYVPISI